MSNQNHNPKYNLKPNWKINPNYTLLKNDKPRSKSSRTGGGGGGAFVAKGWTWYGQTDVHEVASE